MILIPTYNIVASQHVYEHDLHVSRSELQVSYKVYTHNVFFRVLVLVWCVVIITDRGEHIGIEQITDWTLTCKSFVRSGQTTWWVYCKCCPVVQLYAECWCKSSVGASINAISKDLSWADWQAVRAEKDSLYMCITDRKRTQNYVWFSARST